MSARQAILEELLRSTEGDLTEALSRYVLSIRFSPEQVARYEALAYRAQDGNLTPQERDELDAFLSAETFLIVLKAKARKSLEPQSPAA